MEDRKTSIRSIVVFIVVAYVISGIGYYFNYQGIAAGLFLSIFAPILSAYLIYFLNHRRTKLMICKFSMRGVLVGAGISTAYMLLSLLIFLLMGNKLGNYKFTADFVLEIIILYLFSAFCEEVGWRGALLPMLKKVMNLETACLVNGIIWFGWHIPLIVNQDMIKEHSMLMAFVLLAIETICVSFIMGFLSETKMGKSIWTYVSLHAIHNIIIQLILPCLTTKLQRYFGDAGYILIVVLVVMTIGIWIFGKKKEIVK